MDIFGACKKILIRLLQVMVSLSNLCQLLADCRLNNQYELPIYILTDGQEF